jgi:hypothetical protein
VSGRQVVVIHNSEPAALVCVKLGICLLSILIIPTVVYVIVVIT